MASVGEALYAVLAAKARRSVAPRRTGAVAPSWRESLDYLIGEHGSASGVARELGLPPSTVRHWRAGRKPKDPSRLILAAVRAQRGG